MSLPPSTATLVSPTALALSLLHAGRGAHAHVTIARSREDFMLRALAIPYAAAVVERDWLSTFELRRLALRRVFQAWPRLVLVLARDQEPTAFERRRYDAIVVAQPVFTRAARDLQRLSYVNQSG